MRLWHKDMITVLPREQLVSQWRELSSIAGSAQKNGGPNHLLVNFVMDYDFDHFISYAYYVRAEMTKRSCRTMDSVWNKIVALKPDYLIVPLNELYKGKMNSIYFDICWYNLYENTYAVESKKKIGVKLMNWRNEPATKKQLAYIMRMQEDAGINGALPLPTFRGKTKGEASDYINENQGKQFRSFDFSSHSDNYGDRI